MNVTEDSHPHCDRFGVWPEKLKSQLLDRTLSLLTKRSVQHMLTVLNSKDFSTVLLEMYPIDYCHCCGHFHTIISMVSVFIE